MLEKRFLRKLTIEECHGYVEDIERDLALTARRLGKLRDTQAKNPGWAHYDKYADDIVGIDIRIEEQYAVQGELEDDLKQINERINIILQVVAITGNTPWNSEPVYQLGFFDSAKNRERIGVPW